MNYVATSNTPDVSTFKVNILLVFICYKRIIYSKAGFLLSQLHQLQFILVEISVFTYLKLQLLPSFC